VVRILLSALFSSIFIAPVSKAASDTDLLIICTSLRTDHQYISASGKCNERIYEKSTWYEQGMAPSGTSGSKTVSITLCTSKSRSNLRILAKEGRSCNRAYQTQTIFQRPLGPPSAPELISVIADTLGTAIITMKAPLADGGARIRSYEVIEVGSTTPGNKVLATIATSFPIKAQQSTKISGLIPSQSYRFAIRAINAIGFSPLAQSSAVFFAPTLPGAPSITSAVANSFNSAQITFSPAPSDGGSPVTSYTITAWPSRLQSTFLATDAKHHTFTGLSASTSYTFTIQATNIAGSGLASAPSNQITTFAPPPPPEPVAPTPFSSPSSSAPALAAPAFTLSSSSETRTVNTAATGFTINSTGGVIASFAISATPAGMSFSTSTGALTGTPTTVASATAYTITATNASGSATQTFTLTVSPGAATKAMMTTQPAGAVSGSAFTTQPVVRVTDSAGNTVTTSTAVVTVSKASGSGTLSGTTTATAVAGVATFTNLVITGTGDHVLTFTPATLTAVNSETLTVSLATQATLSITSLTTSTKAHPYAQALSITTSGGSGTGATTFAIASGGTATDCALSNSTATATIASTTVGTCLIQATKAADATYASTTSTTATFTFTKATQTITFTDPADITFGASPASLSATSTSTLSVAFTTATSGVCTVSGTTVTIVSAGTCTITANQAGNADYEAASQVSQSFTIAKATPSLSNFANVSKTVGNSAFDLSAPTVANSLPGSFTYTSGTTATATIANSGGVGTVTIVAAGSSLITATFAPTDTTNYNNSTITMTLTVTAALTCATGGTCIVGDTGPGGGKVFYVATTPFACGPTRSATCRYLEAAPSGWNTGTDPTRSWASDDNISSPVSSPGADGTAIGTGYQNSKAIVDQAGNVAASSAAVLARAYRGNNLTDWYLPSKDELNQMCKWARGVAWTSDATLCAGGTINTGLGATGFVESNYWSSTQAGWSAAVTQSFSNGNQTTNVKNFNRYVRPVRAF
jgi:hypothetical protein